MNNSEFLPTENICGHAKDETKRVGGICSNPPVPPTPPVAPPPPTTTTVSAAPLELHVCMGLNACKGHDRNGTNSCAGTGYCATAAVHHCRTLNDCRGQGGCGLYGDPTDDDTPGANECAWQGACAVPIQAERYSTEGANKGKSVWVLARKLFEERMQTAKRSFGASPYPCGPPEEWLTQTLGEYDSCGSSGDKRCSFGFNDAAKDAQELCQKSLHPVICGSPQAAESNHCGAEQNHCSAEQNHCDSPKDNDDAVHCGSPKNEESFHCGAPKNDESVHCGAPENGGETNHCNSPGENPVDE